MTDTGTPYITVASLANDAECRKARDFILEDIVFVGMDSMLSAEKLCEMSKNDPEPKKLTVPAMDAAGFGIPGFSYTGKEIAIIRNRIGSDTGNQTFVFVTESRGTREMFGLAGHPVDALKSGKTLIVDGFGVNLHPIVTRWIVGRFSADFNPNGAQLIANSRDVGLMDTDNLPRRDPIRFANKSHLTGNRNCTP